MHHDLALGYVGIEVPDPTTLSPFFGDVIGLVPGEPADDGTLTWRNDDAAHRVLVEPGAANDAAFVGFETASDDAFDAVVARMQHAGYQVTDATDDELKARRVDRLVRTESPWGVTIEITRGLARATTPFDSALMPGGFL